MNKVSLLVLLFAVIGIIASAQSCFGSNNDDLLQSGFVTFASPNSQNSRENCQSVLINYTIPSNGFKAAVALYDLGGYKFTSGIDYSVQGSQKGFSN
jgi:hypothetical protein